MLCNIYGIVGLFFPIPNERVAHETKQKECEVRTHIPSHFIFTMNDSACFSFDVCVCFSLSFHRSRERISGTFTARRWVTGVQCNETVCFLPFFPFNKVGDYEFFSSTVIFVGRNLSSKCDEQNIVIYALKIFIENCGQLWLHNFVCCFSFSWTCVACIAF